MPVHFTCPHCQEQTLVDDEFAGHSGNCIQCGRPIVVPGIPASQTATAIAQRERRKKRLYWPLLAVVGLAVAGATLGMCTLLMAILQPALQVARANSMKSQCARNLRQIGAALMAYEAEHGSLPPAYVADSAGKPLHSWRVLILPYLGNQEKELYREYDLSLPWSSPENMRLLGRMPSVFACPADPNALPRGETSYMVVVGKGSLFPGSTSLSRSRAIDGLEQTIMVVEVRSAGTSWLEPKDLTEGVVMYQVGIDIGGNHTAGANALLANGETEFLPINMPPEHVQALLSPAGNEPNPLLE